MNKRKLCKYDQWIQEVAQNIFDLEAYGSNEETSQAIHEAIRSDYIYMLLESDILTEIKQIISTSVKP
jgi:flavorubredoxin|tara:strand:+ start:450 stop:653 length:204 start_codon:yes stop_codon:yes gene_type:complete